MTSSSFGPFRIQFPMSNWGQALPLVRHLLLLPLGGLAMPSPRRQEACLQQATPLLGIPGQYGPADIHLIAGPALGPAVPHAMIGCEMTQHWLNMGAQALQPLEPGGVGLRIARLTPARDAQLGDPRGPQPCSVDLEMMESPIPGQLWGRLAKHLTLPRTSLA